MAERPIFGVRKETLIFRFIIRELFSKDVLRGIILSSKIAVAAALGLTLDRPLIHTPLSTLGVTRAAVLDREERLEFYEIEDKRLRKH